MSVTSSGDDTAVSFDDAGVYPSIALDTFDALKERNITKRAAFQKMIDDAADIKARLEGLILETHLEDDALDSATTLTEAVRIPVMHVLSEVRANTCREFTSSNTDYSTLKEVATRVVNTVFEVLRSAKSETYKRHMDTLQAAKDTDKRDLADTNRSKKELRETKNWLDAMEKQVKELDSNPDTVALRSNMDKLLSSEREECDRKEEKINLRNNRSQCVYEEACKQAYEQFLSETETVDMRWSKFQGMVAEEELDVDDSEDGETALTMVVTVYRYGQQEPLCLFREKEMTMNGRRSNVSAWLHGVLKYLLSELS